MGGDGVDSRPADGFALAATSPVLSPAPVFSPAGPVFAPARTIAGRPPPPSGDIAGSSATAPQSDTPGLPQRQPAPGRDDPELLRRLHDYVHVQVRSGAFDPARLRELARRATRSEVADAPRADALAERVVCLELAGWRAESARWRGRTDPERLDAALARLTEQGLAIRAAATDEPGTTTGPDSPTIGRVAYSVTDVWAALDHGELPLTVHDADGQPAGRHSMPVRAVIDALAGEGLLASVRPDGRIAVPLTWRRRASEE